MVIYFSCNISKTVGRNYRGAQSKGPAVPSLVEWGAPNVLKKKTLLSRFQGSVANQIGQARNESDFVQPVVQVLPKRKAKFTARLL